MTAERLIDALGSHLQAMASSPPIDESEDDQLKGWNLACQGMAQVLATLRKVIATEDTQKG